MSSIDDGVLELILNCLFGDISPPPVLDGFENEILRDILVMILTLFSTAEDPLLLQDGKGDN